jgi:hypothetical protein
MPHPDTGHAFTDDCARFLRQPLFMTIMHWPDHRHTPTLPMKVPHTTGGTISCGEGKFWHHGLRPFPWRRPRGRDETAQGWEGWDIEESIYGYMTASVPIRASFKRPWTSWAGTYMTTPSPGRKRGCHGGSCLMLVEMIRRIGSTSRPPSARRCGCVVQSRAPSQP